MPDYKEKARRVYDKLGTGSIADSERIENALREAHEAGKREERERCAGIALAEPEFPGEPSDLAIALMESAGPVANARSACRTTKKSIAAAILSEQGDV